MGSRGGLHFGKDSVGRAKTNKTLVSLLEAVGGERMAHALLDLAKQHESNVMQCTRTPVPTNLLRKLADHDVNDFEACERDGRPEPVVSLTQVGHRLVACWFSYRRLAMLRVMVRSLEHTPTEHCYHMPQRCIAASAMTRPSLLHSSHILAAQIIILYSAI